MVESLKHLTFEADKERGDCGMLRPKLQFLIELP